MNNEIENERERLSLRSPSRLIGSLPDHKQDMLAITTAAATCFNSASPIFGQSSAVQRRNVAPVLSEVDLSRKFKRAEFWVDKEATALEIVNVLGRWDSVDEWKTRSYFVEEGSFNNRQETELQAQTRKRYDMAQRMGVVERVAHYQNVPSMPFKNEAMAASIGKTVEEMNALPRPTKYACNVVYDALAQSKSGLIPPDVVMSRRAGVVGSDGSVDFNALSYGINRARFTVILSWFFFGKGQVIGLLVGLKVLYDTTNIGELLPIPKEVQDVLILFAVIGAAVFAAISQATDDTEMAEALEGQAIPGPAAEEEKAPVA